MQGEATSNAIHKPHSQTRWLCWFAALGTCGLLGTAQARLPSAEAPQQMLDDATLDAFLTQGGWSPTADDTAGPTQLQASFVKGLADAYVKNPSDPKAISALGLIALSQSVAEWGVEPPDGLPADPVGNKWRGVSGGDGKRLMSYSKGGIGIAHADSGLLSDFIKHLQATKGDSLPEAARFYRLRGVNFDVLYANGGHCKKPSTVMTNDLDDKPFGYKEYGYAGDGYCSKYHNGKTNEADWRIFRHDMRLVLREKDTQAWLIDNWLSRYWWPSYRKVAAEENGTIADVLVNARIRNSSPGTADCALAQTRGSADRIAAQLNAYASPTCKGNARHKERWPYMRRAVVLQTFYAQKP
ncbi:hypothetical protein AWB71_02343 [Caballeronia peredens]|nr:hypothetical protein AWB71_02343 [Caballeronia peredens]